MQLLIKRIFIIKQEAHGPQRSHEKMFKSINTSDYHNVELEERKKSLSTL